MVWIKAVNSMHHMAVRPHSADAGSAVEADAVDLTEDTACKVCGSTENDAEMLLCERCDRGYHLGCLSPKLNAIPEDDWYCPKCPKCPSSKLHPSPKAKAKAAKPVVADESDADTDDFQPVPRQTTARPTARQASIRSELIPCTGAHMSNWTHLSAFTYPLCWLTQCDVVLHVYT